MARKKSENPRTILNWSEEDRPREKLLSKGQKALTDAELLAILIRAGTAEMSAVDLARKILDSAHNNINELAKITVTQLMQTRGMGRAKAVTIVAALELGRRRTDFIPHRKRKVTESKAVYEEIRPYLVDKPNEEFWMLLLNRANEVIRAIQVSVGGVSGVAVDIKFIFKIALDHLASSIILIHNHPSGQLFPSEADRILTQQIKEAGQLLDLPILDHVIFADNGYYSFLDEGEM